jgi:hypothetical protein
VGPRVGIKGVGEERPQVIRPHLGHIVEEDGPNAGARPSL